MLEFYEKICYIKHTKGKAIEAALPITISLNLCYKQSAVTIGSSGGYFFFPL